MHPIPLTRMIDTFVLSVLLCTFHSPPTNTTRSIERANKAYDTSQFHSLKDPVILHTIVCLAHCPAPPSPNHKNIKGNRKAKRKERKLTIQHRAPTLAILTSKLHPTPIKQFHDNAIRRFLHIRRSRKGQFERRHMPAFRRCFYSFLDGHCADDEGVCGVEFDPAAFP